ncbi:MAG: hypothetical protein ACT4NY_06820 [Pseudonocardiales bacterium]
MRRGGLACFEGGYYDHGAPIPGCLIPHVAEALLEAGWLELGDPDESGMRPVIVTDAGQARYRALCQLQRRKDPVVP